MKLIQISNFKLGRSVQGFYLCKEKHLRHTRNGDLYLDLMLTDATGIIPGKMWELVNNFQNRFESGDPVAVKGKVGEFNDLLQLIAFGYVQQRAGKGPTKDTQQRRKSAISILASR